jgi:hypothetical protein
MTLVMLMTLKIAHPQARVITLIMKMMMTGAVLSDV